MLDDTGSFRICRQPYLVCYCHLHIFITSWAMAKHMHVHLSIYLHVRTYMGNLSVPE